MSMTHSLWYADLALAVKYENLRARSDDDSEPRDETHDVPGSVRLESPDLAHEIRRRLEVFRHLRASQLELDPPDGVADRLASGKDRSRVRRAVGTEIVAGGG